MKVCVSSNFIEKTKTCRFYTANDIRFWLPAMTLMAGLDSNVDDDCVFLQPHSLPLVAVLESEAQKRLTAHFKSMHPLPNMPISRLAFISAGSHQLR